MLMRITSPLASVKSFAGTTPVPVIKNTPCGNVLSRKRNLASSFGSRFSYASVVLPVNTVFASRAISKRMVVVLSRGSVDSNTQGPRAQLPS
jgi:hypothetical protein